MSESAHQQAYFSWARLHPVAQRAFAIPNGGQRHKATAGRLKAEGVRAGVLDVMLPVARGSCHGLWIEFKFGKNTLSKEQAEEADALVAAGYAVVVAWDWERAKDWTIAYLCGELTPALIVDRC